MANRGHLLGDLLATQARDDQAVSYPAIQIHAEQVLALAATFDRPALLPVGENGARLLGAVEVVSEGAIDAPGWNRDLTGRTVLLVGTVALSLIEFEMAADIARRQGATACHTCVVEAPAPIGANTRIDSFHLLSGRTRPMRRSA